MTASDRSLGCDVANRMRKQSVDTVDRGQEVSEPAPSVDERVDVLADERYLSRAQRDQRGHFADDVPYRAAPLASPDVRDDAVGAVVVASAHRADELAEGRLVRVSACGRTTPRPQWRRRPPSGRPSHSRRCPAVSAYWSVPTTKLSPGTSRRSSSPIRCATQPTTPRAASGLISPRSCFRRPITLSSARSRTLHVLTMTTSAVAGSVDDVVPVAGEYRRRSGASRTRSSGNRMSRRGSS